MPVTAGLLLSHAGTANVWDVWDRVISGIFEFVRVCVCVDLHLCVYVSVM